MLEGLLSADNAMVLAVLVLGLPKEQQRQALRYGILGAFAFRIVATVFAAHMIQLRLVQLIGGLYLLWLPYHHFFRGGDAQERRTPPKATPWLGLSAFWATVVKVELTDIVFAIDSILVAVAMSPKLWVIITGGLLGIVAMRMVIGQLLAIVRRYPALVDGAFVIIAWVGIKLLDRVRAQPGLDPFPGAEVAVAGADRASSSRSSLLYARRQTPPPDADVIDDEANALINDEIRRAPVRAVSPRVATPCGHSARKPLCWR